MGQLAGRQWLASDESPSLADWSACEFLLGENSGKALEYICLYCRKNDPTLVAGASVGQVGVVTCDL